MNKIITQIIVNYKSKKSYIREEERHTSEAYMEELVTLKEVTEGIPAGAGCVSTYKELKDPSGKDARRGGRESRKSRLVKASMGRRPVHKDH